jgi:hypothetical protein
MHGKAAARGLRLGEEGEHGESEGLLAWGAQAAEPCSHHVLERWLVKWKEAKLLRPAPLEWATFLGPCFEGKCKPGAR